MQPISVYFCLAVSFLGACCQFTNSGTTRAASSVSRVCRTSPLAQALKRLLDKIEAGDMTAWQEFAGYENSEGMDGERSLIYSVACAELLRRDPTFLLRRYLLGDAKTLACAHRGYGWSGIEGREILNKVYGQRLAIEESKAVRNQISEFINQTTQVEKRPHFTKPTATASRATR